MKKIFIQLVILCCLFVQGSAQALKISDFYQNTKVGQWILMKSSDGLLTRTAVVAKGDEKLTLKITSFNKDKQISDSEQLIDLNEGKVISIRIYDGGNVKEIYPEKTEMNDFFQIDFKLDGEESIAVEKGFFPCQRYRGVYQDRLVKVWLSDSIPILHLAKISMQAISVEIVDYGGDG